MTSRPRSRRRTFAAEVVRRFPTGVKWGFLPPDTRPRYLVINGDESEPGTFKDRMLLERDPHQLVEGIAISSFAMDVQHAFVYVRGEYPEAGPAGSSERSMKRMKPDTWARRSSGRVRSRRHRPPWRRCLHLRRRNRLLNSLEGRRGEPRIKPPFPAIEGLYVKPTIVNNVETISNVPWIVTNGGAKYRAIGPETSSGTRVMSLSGHLKKPGDYEIVAGITWRELIYDVGGGILDDRDLKAWVPGGASAPWFVPSEHLDTMVTIDDIAKQGSMIGSGAVIVMDDTTNVVDAAQRIVRFFSHESCGQCTPCREGTTWLERILSRILDGYGRPRRHRAAARRVRQHQPGPHVATGHDHDLPPWSLGTAPVVSLDAVFPATS